LETLNENHCLLLLLIEEEASEQIIFVLCDREISATLKFRRKKVKIGVPVFCHQAN
jgi:hypothetical protein